MIAFKSRLKDADHGTAEGRLSGRSRGPRHGPDARSEDGRPGPDLPLPAGQDAQEGAPGHRPGGRSPAGLGRRRRQGRGRRRRFPQPLARPGRGLRRGRPPGRPDVPRPRRAARSSSSTPTSIPNKAAHIGHLRNACLGDTLARCLRYKGETVEVQNYIDDTGVQVVDVVFGLMELERQDDRRPRGACPASSITTAGTSTPGSPPTSPTIPRPRPARRRS